MEPRVLTNVRKLLRFFYSPFWSVKLWCNEPRAVAVSAAKLLELGASGRVSNNVCYVDTNFLRLTSPAGFYERETGK